MKTGEVFEKIKNLQFWQGVADVRKEVKQIWELIVGFLISDTVNSKSIKH